MFYTLERPTSSSTASPRGFTSPPPSRRPPWTIPRRPFTQDTRRRTSSSDDALYGDRVPFPSSDSLEGTSSMRSVGGSDRMRGQSAIASSSTFTRSEHQQNTEDWDLRLPPLSGSDSVGMMIDSSGGTSSRVSSDTFQLPPTWYYTTEVIQGPAGVRGTVGASATSIPVRFSYDPSPRNPARALKFSPCQGEGELLVFTEQTTRFHVIDARTFNQHDIVKVPVYHPGHQERWASTSRSSSVDSHRTASAPGRQSWASMLGIPPQHGEGSQDISQDVDQLREDDGEDDDTEMEELAQDNPNWAGISRSLDEIGRDVDRFASGMNSHGWRPLPMFGGGARTSTSSVSSPSGPTTGGYRIFAPRATSTGTPSRYALYIDSGMAGVGAGYGPEADVITWRTPPVYPGETDPQITGISFDPTGRWVYVGTEWGLYEWEVEGRRRAFGVEETGDYA
ncbi:hypothetical protein FRC03_012056 [Tulasnella sp. 419]|nr:hypothetical protein FRC03_012056 [Tulasnella sp. 419]